MTFFEGKYVQRIVILTGAGISAESGIATFRDADGLWENHDPMEIATPEAFARNPDLVYRFYNERRVALNNVQPNAAHRSLAKLEQVFPGDVFLITQNVDDLHERGGSRQVCHMHGQLKSMLCTKCHHRMPALASFDARNDCSNCGLTGALRPDVVWFGEMPYFMAEIEAQLSDCDLFIAIGTSGQVYPAAGFVQIARAAGATAIEINREISDVSELFHHHRQGLATSVVPELVDELLG
ncbi:MAG: NAD-dependent deacylase [Pseudomonadota bacterium]